MRKQLKGEPVEKYYGFSRELSLNCDLGSHEESIIQDVFTANLHDGEIQRKLLKETRIPTKALELAINVEMGIQNQVKNFWLNGIKYKHQSISEKHSKIVEQFQDKRKHF